MHKVVIVTGANGFLGNNIIRLLEKDDNYEIRAFILKGTDKSSLDGLRCKIYEGDVTDKITLDEVFKGSEDTKLYVIHCAAVVSIKSKKDEFISKVNVDGVKNIVEKVIEKNARLVYISSVHAITEKDVIITETKEFNPELVVGAYAKSKAEAARYIISQIDKGLDAVILHPSGIIGPNDFGNTHLTELVSSVAENRISVVVNGGYNFVDVRDCAEAIISSLEKGKKGESYLITNVYISIKKLVNMIAKYSKTRSINFIMPTWVLKLLAPLSELYHQLRKETPIFTSYSLYTLGTNGNFSNEKAKNELDYNPRPIEETVRDTVKWLKNRRVIN